MTERDFWKRALKEAERELDAATTRSDVKAAAKKLQLAKAELKRLEQKGGGLTSGVGRNASTPNPTSGI